VWQRSYYEHVIRSEEEFYRISEYILGNPGEWGADRENSNASVKGKHLPFEY
jgi:hypothetical protein